MKKLLPLVIVILLNGCAGTRQTKTAAGSLKDTYKKDFLIGAAISWRQVLIHYATARAMTTQG
ncbi:hypothetical protein [Niabella sp.]|uniref:hypothetical protein n=1 Tax=Niabella sp. TaxID=1962976 RepID=UPI002621874B|nr:hypothetical protein [Niabella sp.]